MRHAVGPRSLFRLRRVIRNLHRRRNVRLADGELSRIAGRQLVVGFADGCRRRIGTGIGLRFGHGYRHGFARYHVCSSGSGYMSVTIKRELGIRPVQADLPLGDLNRLMAGEGFIVFSGHLVIDGIAANVLVDWVGGRVRAVLLRAVGHGRAVHRNGSSHNDGMLMTIVCSAEALGGHGHIAIGDSESLEAGDDIVTASDIIDLHSRRAGGGIVAIADGIFSGRDQRISILHREHRRCLGRAVIGIAILYQCDRRALDLLRLDRKVCTGIDDAIVIVRSQRALADGIGARILTRHTLQRAGQLDSNRLVISTRNRIAQAYRIILTVGLLLTCNGGDLQRSPGDVEALYRIGRQLVIAVVQLQCRNVIRANIHRGLGFAGGVVSIYTVGRHLAGIASFHTIHRGRRRLSCAAIGEAGGRPGQADLLRADGEAAGHVGGQLVVGIAQVRCRSTIRAGIGLATGHGHRARIRTNQPIGSGDGHVLGLIVDELGVRPGQPRRLRVDGEGLVHSIEAVIATLLVGHRHGGGGAGVGVVGISNRVFIRRNDCVANLHGDGGLLRRAIVGVGGRGYLNRGRHGLCRDGEGAVRSTRVITDAGHSYGILACVGRVRRFDGVGIASLRHGIFNGLDGQHGRLHAAGVGRVLSGNAREIHRPLRRQGGIRVDIGIEAEVFNLFLFGIRPALEGAARLGRIFGLGGLAALADLLLGYSGGIRTVHFEGHGHSLDQLEIQFSIRNPHLIIGNGDGVDSRVYRG